jgi:predicted ATPase/class 3 adenylate cyclase
MEHEEAAVPGLPTGTVTFLFADIEGSTRLLQHLGDRYAEVLAGCRRLLRAAYQKRGAEEVDTQGDALFVAFSRAKDAVAAAVAAQRAISAHPWPDGTAVRVRMGLHTGEPLSAETGYVGLDVHRAARICAAGHGGQILLSGTTRELVQNDLPEGISLRDLGLHRLRDLAQSQHLFQVVIPNSPRDFPPLNTLDTLPNNLPRLLTSFIGREREMAEIKQLLSTTCLLTLTGAGGSGKTRLALQVAADLLEQYPDGVWFVELAARSDPALVPLTVASSLGVHEHPRQELTETLVDHLRPKSLLILLDNCEHLLVACARLADGVLRACPNVRVIATSREGLGIGGETLYPVPALPDPDPQRMPPMKDLIGYEAVRLFLERATAVVPTFTITAQNAQAVAQICHRLDGIPLAIELAAARVKALGVDQLVARLDDRFRLLTGGSRTALPRHQTLRAAMDWSFALLTEQEQILLRRLSVFAGGWSLEAAEAICPGDAIEGPDILDLLTRLVDRSLVIVEPRSGEARYHLLETVRQYARDRLLESGEAAGIRIRHQGWFLALAERAEPELRGPSQMIWLERLKTEHDNLRVALEWSKMDANSALLGVRLVGALQWFWFMFMHNYVEGREWLQWALSRATEVPAHTRAKLLTGAGMMAWVLYEHERARALLQESLSLFRRLGDNWAIAFALHHLAHVAVAQGDFGQGTTLFEESLALFRETGDRWGLGLTLTCLGDAAIGQGDYHRAEPLLEESLTLFREAGSGLSHFPT